MLFCVCIVWGTVATIAIIEAIPLFVLSIPNIYYKKVCLKLIFMNSGRFIDIYLAVTFSALIHIFLFAETLTMVILFTMLLLFVMKFVSFIVLLWILSCSTQIISPAHTGSQTVSAQINKVFSSHTCFSSYLIWISSQSTQTWQNFRIRLD